MAQERPKFERALRAIESGERFGMLEVLSRGENGKDYFLRCDCGRRIVMNGERLIGARHNCRTSCGCVRKRPMEVEA